jgi:UDP-N-acetylglucosamine acyltransferase
MTDAKTSVEIHPTAIVSPGAQLDAGVVVGPFCVVGPHVRLGKETRLHSHVVVEGHTTLGERNEVFPFASVGHAPQDLKFKGEPTTLVIGDENRIREGATLQPGTVQDRGTTIIGSRNLFMAYTHVAHDCVIGDEVILANATQLAGHVIIESRAVLGSMSAVHQFCRVGELAMVGANAMVASDLAPFCLAQGDRATLRGLNLVGLKRRGFGSEGIGKVKAAYKILFLAGHPTLDAALAACTQAGLSEEPGVKELLAFVKDSGRRGLMRPDSDNKNEGKSEGKQEGNRGDAD